MANAHLVDGGGGVRLEQDNLLDIACLLEDLGNFVLLNRFWDPGKEDLCSNAKYMSKLCVRKPPNLIPVVLKSNDCNSERLLSPSTGCQQQ